MFSTKFSDDILFLKGMLKLTMALNENRQKYYFFVTVVLVS